MESTAEDDVRERPLDLERYELRAQQHEQQQLQEPPYQTAQQQEADVAINEEILQLLEDSAVENDQEGPARMSEVGSPPTTLARIQTRVDSSPDRVSVGIGSEMSAKTATSKEIVAASNREPSEPELLPERAAERDVTRSPQSPRVAGQAAFDQMLLQLGTLVQQALQEQVTPALSQMMQNQARLETRLEQLESVSRGASIDGEALAERAQLLTLGAAREGVTAAATAGLGAPGSHQDLGSELGVQIAARSSTGPPGAPMEVDGEVGIRGKSGKPAVRDPPNPSEGMVMMAGVQYAWQVTADGLQLRPLGSESSLAPVASPSESLRALQDREFRLRGIADMSAAAPSEVFGARAHSPFKRVLAPQSEPWDVGPSPVGQPRSLKPTQSDPLPASPPGLDERRASPPKGSQAAQQLAVQSHDVIQPPQVRVMDSGGAQKHVVARSKWSKVLLDKELLPL